MPRPLSPSFELKEYYTTCASTIFVFVLFVFIDKDDSQRQWRLMPGGLFSWMLLIWTVRHHTSDCSKNVTFNFNYFCISKPMVAVLSM